MEGVSSYAGSIFNTQALADGCLLFPSYYYVSLMGGQNPEKFIKKVHRKGRKPALFISEVEVIGLAETLKFTLIGKFSIR